MGTVYRMDYFGIDRPAGSGLLNLARVPSY
jgi:hypothetical protein